MRLPNRHRAEPLEVKMTPMIDVVFLLLIFFVWTSSFELPEFDLPSAIAETPAGGIQDNASEPPPVEVFDEIIIKLKLQDATTWIEFNGQRLSDVQQLRAKVADILALGVQPPVIVDPDDRVTMDRAIEVYDAVRLAGADRVLFAAHP